MKYAVECPPFDFDFEADPIYPVFPIYPVVATNVRTWLLYRIRYVLYSITSELFLLWLCSTSCAHYLTSIHFQNTWQKTLSDNYVCWDRTNLSEDKSIESIDQSIIESIILSNLHLGSADGRITTIEWPVKTTRLSRCLSPMIASMSRVEIRECTYIFKFWKFR